MYTQEQLTEIEQFASRAFTVREIAIIINVPVDEFEKCFFDEAHPVHIAYMRGSLKAQLDIRNALFNSAISGSSPAQVEIAKSFTNQINYLKILKADA
jgi:hypothetical protein